MKNNSNTSLKFLFLFLSLGLVLVSCSTSKSLATSRKTTPVKVDFATKPTNRVEGLRNLESKFSGRIPTEIQSLLKDAQKYLGAPYRFGGNTSAGFDCSGFTLAVFEQNSYRLPRISSEQAKTGSIVDIKDVMPGDLLFFATSGGGRVSHVGIVYDIGNNGEVKFIHSSTSKGVIISSLNEKYWNKAYLHATRVL